MFIYQACLQALAQSWIYQALGLLREREGESWWFMSRSPAIRQVEVCISVMALMQQVLGQAQKKRRFLALGWRDNL